MIDNDTLHSSSRLYAPIVDLSGELRDFALTTIAKFQSAGLLKLDHNQATCRFPMHTKIINNRAIRTKKLKVRSGIQERLPRGIIAHRLAVFDVRALCAKFHDFAWASDFPLERLCISAMAYDNIVKDGKIIGRGSQEIASIPLPGIEHLEREPELQNVTYEIPRTIYV